MNKGILKDGWIELSADGSGYPIVETPPPSVLVCGYKAVAHYEQQGDRIVKIWETQPLTDEERETMEGQEEVV